MAKTRAPYPEAFRAEAVELVRTSDQSIPVLAGELGVSEQAPRDWVRRAAGARGDGAPPAAATVEPDLARRRRENRRRLQERESLKQAAACFANETRP